MKALSKEVILLSKEFLKKKIVPIDIERIDTISGMLSAFNDTSFQSRNLARCVEIFTRMLEDPDEPTIFLGLAGAMIPAGMKKVVSTMVKRRMVDVIVTTCMHAHESTNQRLKPKLERTAKIGTRIVSYAYEIKEWKAAKNERLRGGGPIHLYTVPESINRARKRV